MAVQPPNFRKHVDSQLVFDASIIYAARADPNAAPPHILLGLNEVMPELQAVINDFYGPSLPPGPNLNPNQVTLTPRFDISIFDQTHLTTVRRDGSNGRTLRALAMTYKPAGLTLRMTLPQDMADAMYSFYGDSSLEILTSGNYPIYLHHLSPEVSDLEITTISAHSIASLDPIVERMVHNPNNSFRFSFKASDDNVSPIRPMRAVPMKRMMRNLVSVALNAMKTSTNPTLSMQLFFTIDRDPQRDDNDTHEYLERIVGETNGVNYQSLGDRSIVVRPAAPNVLARVLTFEYRPLHDHAPVVPVVLTIS